MKPSEYVGHYVRAVYDFETTHPREINLQKGDIIKVTKHVDNNWLHGLNRNVEGNFPSSFVEKILLPAISQGHTVFGAIENFPAQQDGDLQFRKGDIIEGTQKIDDNWWQGKISTHTGIFPTTHVIELEVPQALRERAASIHSSEPMFARALCDSVAQLDEELGFHAGDMVMVTEIIDDDWYYGELGNKKGMFLSSCVELIQDTYALSSNNTTESKADSSQNNVISRQSAIDEPPLSVPEKGYNSADINANINSQMESYSEFSAELNQASEYDTQFSNENTRSLESYVSPYGMTLYPFIAESPNELSFNENEIVYLIQHVDSQWIEGQIDDKIGIFPANFVSIVVDCPYAYDTDTVINEQDANQSESSMAYSESSMVNSESSMANSESSMATNESLTNEMKSVTNTSSLRNLNDTEETGSELPPFDQYGLVLYDFVAEVDTDLSVYAGETVVVVKNIDSNWVQVKNDHGQLGMVPQQFLDIVSEIPDLPVQGYYLDANKDSEMKTNEYDTNICDKSLNKRKSSDIDKHNKINNKHSHEKGILNDKLHSKSMDDNIPVYTACSKIGSFKKPALPAKPKPSLAPKPILKPKPILSTKPKIKQEENYGATKAIHSPKITKSLTFQDDSSLHKSSSTQSLSTKDHSSNQLLKSVSTTDISNGSNTRKTEISKESMAAFNSLDSIVKSEMKKEIEKSESGSGTGSLDSVDSGETDKVEMRKSGSVSFNKAYQSENKKRHSVNFPMLSSTTNSFNTQKSRQSVAFSNSTKIEQPSLKVGQSTFFTDFSADLVPAKVGPMRKPPPPPQKLDTVDFSRKPSLRKPPPPRPTVPKERPLSPSRPSEGPTISNITQKSKRSDKMKKNQAKIPRPHITPTRPAPQRPLPGQIPRRLPPQPTNKLDNLMSFSPPSEELPDDTNIEIIEDLKQRIKEVEADLQKYKKSKDELENSQSEEEKDTEIHDNIEFYTANIEGLTQELETLKENLNRVLPSSELSAVAKQMEEEERKKIEEKRREEDKKRAEEERIKRRDKRERVIEELIQTERNYLHGLHLCIETFISPAAEKNPNVDIDAVFGNIEDVADVSQRLLTLLENAVNGQDFEDQFLGPCFTQLCDDMKNAYAPYCRNHDEVIALLEKYREDQSIKQYFDTLLNRLREQIVVFDLEALLIKPVQRILKYPLLLNELIKSTEDSHKDKVEILNGINAMTDVAKAINEYKRRKDLVYKYKRDTDQTLGDMLSKLNLHSLKKKGSRFKGRLSTNLGIAPQTKDGDFDKEEAKFREIERTVKLFAKDVQTYMDQLQDSYSCHEGVMVDLIDFYDEKTCPEVQKYQKLYQTIQDQFLPEFTTTVTEIVVNPLSKLIVMFNAPNKVIQKRFDKLLDYDSMQRKEKEGSEKSLKETKSNYEALNAQLLDELPKMYSLSFKLLKDCVGTFVHAQKKFYNCILNNMTEIIDMLFLLQSEGTVMDNFNIRHVAVNDKMSLLRIIPKGFNPKMEALGKPVVGKSADKKSKRMSMDPTALPPSPVASSTQSDSQRVFLQQKYTEDKLYMVTSPYTASELMDLSVSEGVCVGLVRDKDPMGNKDRWFVDTGATQGFVPKTVLKLYYQTTTSSSASLYPSMDQNLVQSDVTSNVIDQTSPLRPTQTFVSDSSIGQNSTNQNIDLDDELDFALDEDMSPNISSEEFYQACFAFEARNNNEISLFEGQVVTVLIKHDQENNTEWWFADADGVKGYAPANYLQPMR